MNPVKVLRNIDYRVRLECECPYGEMYIFKTADTAPLMIDFTDGKTFRYFLRTLSAGGLSPFTLRKLPNWFQQSSKLLSVRIGNKTIIRIGPNKKHVNYRTILTHIARLKLGV